MADFTFDVALGWEAYYASLPATNDEFVVLLLKSSGLQADSTLRVHSTVSSILAASNDECDFTNYTRLHLAAGDITVTLDTTNHRRTIAADDPFLWSSAGGATDNTVGKLIVAYDPDNTGGSDTTLVPLWAQDVAASTNGVDFTLTQNVSGSQRMQG